MGFGLGFYEKRHSRHRNQKMAQKANKKIIWTYQAHSKGPVRNVTENVARDLTMRHLRKDRMWMFAGMVASMWDNVENKDDQGQ